MTYAEATTGAADQAWLDRVEAAIFEAAIAITVDVPNAGIDTRRDILARKILRGHAGAQFLENFALAVALGFLADVNLTAVLVTDVEIDSRVSAVFNKFAEGHFGS